MACGMHKASRQQALNGIFKPASGSRGVHQAVWSGTDIQVPASMAHLEHIEFLQCLVPPPQAHQD